MTINEVVHNVTTIKNSVSWTVLDSYLWAGLSYKFAEKQFIFSYCRFCCAYVTEHMILLQDKFRRSCEYNQDVQNLSTQQIRQLSQAHLRLSSSLIFITSLCRHIQLLTDCFAYHKGSVWKDKGFIYNEECSKHLACSVTSHSRLHANLEKCFLSV